MKWFRFKLISIFCIYLFFPCLLSAQTVPERYVTEYQIDSLKTKEFRLDIDNLFFFKNNEFSSSVMKGYTLPGAWINPKLSYVPLPNIKFEAGAYMLWYSGAYKYPNYAYQDIAQWKGKHYQNGIHLLPYFRGQIALGNFNFVLGDIYGGSNHRLILPLYNPELDLTADPESGLQILYDAPRFHLDAWINWQSFIFDTDTHQESFIAGVASEIKFNSPLSKWHWYMPVQMVAQHRGGEIDTITTHSVQTLMNGTVGIGGIWNTGYNIFKSLNIEVDVLGYYQQAGQLWPFENGYGLYTRATAQISDFQLKASYWKCHQFISMFGNPFYGAVSTIERGGTFDNPSMVYLGAEYCRVLAKGFSLGIDVDFYTHLPVVFQNEVGEKKKNSSKMSFSAGIYLRINPSFIIKSLNE